MHYDSKETGKRIGQLRMLKGLTQEEFAEKVNLSPNTIAKIECGLRNASMDLLIQMSMLFDVSIDFLLLGKTDEDFRKEMREEIDQGIENIDVMVTKLLEKREELLQMRKEYE
ncbi:MAG: helix-turn-helix domain-containing protein [Lachnospiraceae bacterium]|nr:helix-turn-helix domain-containing protein [Lachnospiraceae bacterium]